MSVSAPPPTRATGHSAPPAEGRLGTLPQPTHALGSEAPGGEAPGATATWSWSDPERGEAGTPGTTSHSSRPPLPPLNPHYAHNLAGAAAALESAYLRRSVSLRSFLAAH